MSMIYSIVTTDLRTVAMYSFDTNARGLKVHTLSAEHSNFSFTDDEMVDHARIGLMLEGRYWRREPELLALFEMLEPMAEARDMVFFVKTREVENHKEFDVFCFERQNVDRFINIVEG